jgi:aldose 1-epimerase
MHNNNYINVIEGYDSVEDFKQNVTSKGFRSCKLSPFACRINKGTYVFNDTTYTIEKNYQYENALHGLLYDAEFTVVKQYTNDNHAALTLLYSYNGWDKGYPFNYDCEVTYQLESNNKLVLSSKITNRNQHSIPIQDGWHPYFTLGESINVLQLEFQSKEHIVFNDRLIPTGNNVPYVEYNALKVLGDQFFDDCFSLNMAECQPLCVLRDPVQKIQIEIRPGKCYPFIQFYTPDHRKSIAIENLSAPPDCFNSGVNLQLLEPGGTAFFDTTYQVKSL